MNTENYNFSSYGLRKLKRAYRNFSQECYEKSGIQLDFKKEEIIKYLIIFRFIDRLFKEDKFNRPDFSDEKRKSLLQKIFDVILSVDFKTTKVMKFFNKTKYETLKRNKEKKMVDLVNQFHFYCDLRDFFKKILNESLTQEFNVTKEKIKKKIDNVLKEKLSNKLNLNETNIKYFISLVGNDIFIQNKEFLINGKLIEDEDKYNEFKEKFSSIIEEILYRIS